MSRFLERQPVFRIIDGFHNERFRSWVFLAEQTRGSCARRSRRNECNVIFSVPALIRFDGKTNLFHAQTIALPMGHLLSLSVHKNSLLIHKLFTAPDVNMRLPKPQSNSTLSQIQCLTRFSAAFTPIWPHYNWSFRMRGQ